MNVAGIFLLPNGTFFVELAVFVLLLVIAQRKILPPLNKMLESRQEKIRASLEAADAARAEADQAGDERARLLGAAREQAREIVAGAQATSDQLKAEAGGRAQVEYDRILTAAQSEVVAARQRAIDEASAHLGDVVFDLVTKVVGREVDQRAHEDLVREAVDALKAEATKESTT